MDLQKQDSTESIGLGITGRNPSSESTEALPKIPPVYLTPTATSINHSRRWIEYDAVLEPNFGPPAEELDEHLYDSCAYIIHCEQHKNIAISWCERSRANWLPFVALRDKEQWQTAAHQGKQEIDHLSRNN